MTVNLALQSILIALAIVLSIALFMAYARERSNGNARRAAEESNSREIDRLRYQILERSRLESKKHPIKVGEFVKSIDGNVRGRVFQIRKDEVHIADYYHGGQIIPMHASLVERDLVTYNPYSV